MTVLSADWTLRGARIRSWRDAVRLAHLSAHDVLPLCTAPLHGRAPADLRPGDVFCFLNAMLDSPPTPPWHDDVAWEETEVQEGFRVHYRFGGMDRELRRRHLAAETEVDGESHTVHVVAYDYTDERADDGVRSLDELLAFRSSSSWPAPRSAYYTPPPTLPPILPPPSPRAAPETAYPTPLSSPCAARPPAADSASAATRQSASPPPRDSHRELLSVAMLRDLHTAVFPSPEGCARRIAEHKKAVCEPPPAMRCEVDEEMLRRLRVRL